MSEDKVPSRMSFVRILAATALISFLLSGFDVLSHWLAVSQYGNFMVSMLLLFSMFLSFMPFFFSMLGIPVSLICIFFKRIRRISVTVLFVSLVYFLIAYSILPYSDRVRMHGFEELAKRSAPLVEAIHRFEEDNGSPPMELADLVPEYLKSIPTTGMGSYPEYGYENFSIDEPGMHIGYEFGENPWILYVYTSWGLGFDWFLYFPNQDYPRTGYGGVLKRLGDWAYVYE